MSTMRENRPRVPGATVFYRVRGTGPLLLILQGGPGDVDAAEALCAQLAYRYTVVTYDRRGQARSPIDAAGPPSIATHGDDAHHLLAALTTEPALVPRELFVVRGPGHVDLYDRVNFIPFDKITAFFSTHLK